MKILVLSPHADDAVFSCADHIRGWIRSGHTVSVCTVFSRFTPSRPGKDTLAYVRNSGYIDMRRFEKARQHEDKVALRHLGVRLITPGLIDGAFYRFKGKNIYPTFRKLFSGNVVEDDDRITKLMEYLRRVSVSFDRIIAPIGIGSQADHVITARCAAASIAPEKLSYYYDVPYYFFRRNWKRRYLLSLVRKRLSVRWVTKEKVKCMNYYLSQTGLIIRNNRKAFFREDWMFFPELVVSPW